MNLHAARVRAESLQARGDHRAAIEVWRDLLTADPLLADAHAGLAVALLGARRLAGAASEAQATLALDPPNARGLLVLATIAAVERKWQRALDRLDELLAHRPDSVDALVLKASVLRLMGRPRDAATTIAEALELAPGDFRALIERAWQARLQRDLGTVEAIAGSILARNPQHVGALVLIGHVELDRGNRDEARTLALSALEADANDREALELLATVKMMRNPIAGLYWWLLRALSGLSETRRWVISGAYYLVYLMTFSTIRWLRWPELVETAIFIVFLVVSIGLLLTERVIRWQVQRELRQVRLSRDY